jgi:hypothetical protein
MVHAGWFLDSPWWWVALWLPAFGFALPFGSPRKDRKP